jgi:hypothetical protein
MAKQDTLEQVETPVETQVPAKVTQFSELENRYENLIEEANNDPLHVGFVGFVTHADGSQERVDRFGSIEIVAHMKVQVNQLGDSYPLIMQWNTKSGRFLSSEQYMQQAFPGGAAVKDTATIQASQSCTQLENALHAMASSKVYTDAIRAAITGRIVTWYTSLPGGSLDELYNNIETAVSQGKAKA